MVASGSTSSSGGSAVGAGEGIENATIVIYPFQDSAAGTPLTFTTDANGEFSEVLPVGDHFAVIDENNYTSVRKNVTVQAGQTTDLSDIELDYASNTGGTITLAPNNPGESVSVTISGGGEFSNTVSLNTSNRTTYDFSTDVNVDGYTVTYEADNYSTVIETVAVDVNETVQQNVTLRARRAR